MALQVFRAEQHPFQVTTLTVDQVHWFKGREVAACLGYVNPQQALRKNVDEDDRKTYEELTKGVIAGSTPSNQQPHEVYINESGLYSLVLRSEKPEAKAFKRWVTSEVLPAFDRDVTCSTLSSTKHCAWQSPSTPKRSSACCARARCSRLTKSSS